jgi:uncharacterized protein YegL
MDDVKGSLLPIYLVADESGSMTSVVHELNKGLEALLDELHLETMAAAKVRLCILGFSDSCRCLLELADLRNIEVMPDFRATGSTAYSSAFRELRDRIDRDVERLKAEGYLVNRPAVFFLSDGQPNGTDPWESALDDLRSESFKRRPNIIAFGIGSARAATIARVASREEYAFVAASGTDTGRALANFCTALTKSVVSSGLAIASGRAELPVDRPEGFTMALDVID